MPHSRSNKHFTHHLSGNSTLSVVQAYNLKVIFDSFSHFINLPILKMYKKSKYFSASTLPSATTLVQSPSTSVYYSSFLISLPAFTSVCSKHNSNIIHLKIYYISTLIIISVLTSHLRVKANILALAHKPFNLAPCSPLSPFLPLLTLFILS